MKPYQVAWLAKFAPLAARNERLYQVPALFTLAQQLVESAWSMQKLGNNFFGIKASPDWRGSSQVQKTHEYDFRGAKYNTTATFRGYPSEATAYDGHAHFLRAYKRYRPAFAFTDPVKFAEAVAHAGYATDPDYFGKLKTNINFLRGYSLPKEAAAGGALLLLVGVTLYYFSNQSDS